MRFISQTSENRSLTLKSFSSVQSLSRVRLFATPCQASLSITNSRSSLRVTSIKSVMPSSRLICHPLLLLPSIPPSIRVFSKESTLLMKWLKYWSFSFSIKPWHCSLENMIGKTHSVSFSQHTHFSSVITPYKGLNTERYMYGCTHIDT